MSIRSLALPLLLVTACAAPKPVPVAPKVTSETTRLEETDQTLTGFVATATVRLLNEGEAPVAVQGASYELVRSGTVLKKGTVSLSGEIAPGEELIVQVPAPWEYAETQEQLATIAEQKEPLKYALRGNIQYAGGEVEFAKAGAVRSPRLLELKLDTIEVVNSPTRGMTVNALIDLKNPNPFPVALKGLNWKVALAGQPTGEGVLAKNDTAQPASETKYEISFTLEPEAVKKRPELTSGGEKVPYALDGELDLGLVQLEMNSEGEARLLRYTE